MRFQGIIILIFSITVMMFFHLKTFAQLSSAQTANSFYETGCQKFKSKLYKSAIQDFTKTIEKSSYFYEAYCERARCYHKIEQNDKAISDLKKSIELNSQYYLAYLLRAEIYTTQDNYKNALADYDKCLELNPEALDIYIKRSKLHSLYGKHQEALADINSAIQLGFNNDTLYLYRGEVFINLNHKNLALKDLNKSVEILPDYALSYFIRGNLYLSLCDTNSAIKDFDKALELEFINPEILSKRANANFTKRNFLAAEKDYTRLITEFNQKEDIYYQNRGICYFENKKYDQALLDLTRLADQRNDNEIANIYVADIYALQEKYNGAFMYYNKTLEYNPKNYLAREKRAKLYYVMQNYDAAIKDLNIAIKTKPTANAYYIRALCYEAINKRDNACDDLKSASSLGHKEAGFKATDYCNSPL